MTATASEILDKAGERKMSGMNAKTVLAALEAIREADPVADLARDLLDAGVTEEQLHGMLRGKMNDPITLELFNKYRDINGSRFTVNRYGITRRV
jgi:hypothetical protein